MPWPMWAAPSSSRPTPIADVIVRTRDKGLKSYPGVFTPSDAFAAFASGANRPQILSRPKYLGPKGIKAMKAVLPARRARSMPWAAPIRTISPEYFAAGCAGFGLGTCIYKPGMSASRRRRPGQNGGCRL